MLSSIINIVLLICILLSPRAHGRGGGSLGNGDLPGVSGVACLVYMVKIEIL